MFERSETALFSALSSAKVSGGSNCFATTIGGTFASPHSSHSSIESYLHGTTPLVTSTALACGSNLALAVSSSPHDSGPSTPSGGGGMYLDAIASVWPVCPSLDHDVSPRSE